MSKTLTIVVSDEFAESVRELASILEYPEGDLGRMIEDRFGWETKELGWWAAKKPAFVDGIDHGGCLCTFLTKQRWKTKTKAQKIADRVAAKLESGTLIEVFKWADGWGMEFFPAGHQHWRDLWVFCRKINWSYEKAINFVRSRGSVDSYPNVVSEIINGRAFLR